MLTINGIDVFYGDLQVLWDLSFSVNEGEICVLLGANGAGKSTTIKAVSSLLTPAKGSIDFEGTRLDSLPPHKIIEQRIVHVPEGRRLFPEMTVEENLIMGALASHAKPGRNKTAKKVYELFPRLEERKKQHAGTLSGGEQQMLAIGRGLMGKPRLMMLDEPSLGLAPILVSDIFEMIKEINKQGVTILLVEQNVALTLDMCDRAYVLENGRITMEGSGEQLKGDEKIKEAFLGI